MNQFVDEDENEFSYSSEMCIWHKTHALIVPFMQFDFQHLILFGVSPRIVN